MVAELVDREHVGMVECCSSAGFLLEAAHAVWISGERRWKNLDGHFAPRLRIAGAVNFPLTART